MKRLLNTLYVTTRDTKLRVSNNAIVCERPNEEQEIRILSHTIESILCFGNTSVTTPLIQFCGEKGIALSFFSEYGRFYGRVTGPTHGNILLRRAQFHLLDAEPERRLHIVRAILGAKLRNAREVLVRGLREHASEDAQMILADSIQTIKKYAERLAGTSEIETMRALEGLAAAEYFKGFAQLIGRDTGMKFSGREKRPPKDKVNSLMSYLYTLLANDVQSALESVGLDVACGFLHSLRPGKPALALDVMEELRAPLCDRVVLALINRKQIGNESFVEKDGLFFLTKPARRVVLATWQKRKQEEIMHPVLKERIPIGLIPFAQAQLLARTVRGEADAYVPMRWR